MGNSRTIEEILKEQLVGPSLALMNIMAKDYEESQMEEDAKKMDVEFEKSIKLKNKANHFLDEHRKCCNELSKRFTKLEPERVTDFTVEIKDDYVKILGGSVPHDIALDVAKWLIDMLGEKKGEEGEE